MIVVIHNISRKPKNKWEITPKQFKDILNELTEEDEIHFDDARIGVYNYAYPILEKLKHKPKLVIFVVLHWADGFIPDKEHYSKFMTWDQLKELYNKGFEIGSHSVTHSNLTFLSKSQLRRELARSKKVITEKMGVGCIVNKLAYPYGVYNKQVVDMAKARYCRAYILNEIKDLSEIIKSKDFIIPRKLIINSNID